MPTEVSRRERRERVKTFTAAHMLAGTPQAFSPAAGAPVPRRSLRLAFTGIGGSISILLHWL